MNHDEDRKCPLMPASPIQAPNPFRGDGIPWHREVPALQKPEVVDTAQEIDSGLLKSLLARSPRGENAQHNLTVRISLDSLARLEEVERALFEQYDLPLNRSRLLRQSVDRVLEDPTRYLASPDATLHAALSGRITRERWRELARHFYAMQHRPACTRAVSAVLAEIIDELHAGTAHPKTTASQME